MSRAAGRSERRGRVGGRVGSDATGASSGRRLGRDGGGRDVGRRQAHRSRSKASEPGRDRLAVGLEGLLHRDDRDLDHVVGRLLGRDHLDEDARVHEHLDDRVLPVPRAELEDLVADRGDDRDQQDPADDHDERLLPADEAEREDRQEDDDDEELRAAALVGGRVLADLVDGQRVAGLEGVDRHVLGAVVLEHAPDVRRPGDQQQVAEEDRDPDEPSTRCWTSAVVDVRGRDRGDEQRQQEEDPDAGRRASGRASARPSPCRARRPPPRPGRSRSGRASACRRPASRTGRRARGRTAASTSACRGSPSRGARSRRRSRPSGWRRATAIASRPRIRTPSIRAWPP